MSNIKCPFCSDGEMSHQVKPETHSYKGLSITVNQPGMYCNHCDEAILNGDDLKVTRRDIHDLHAAGDGYLTSGEIKRIREKLRLNQKQAAVLLGGGVNAFSRYERGEAKQSKAIDMFLRLLDSDPSLLDRFEFDGENISIKPVASKSWVSVSTTKSHLRVIGASNPTTRSVKGTAKLIGRTIGHASDNKIAVNGY